MSNSFKLQPSSFGFACVFTLVALASMPVEASLQVGDRIRFIDEIGSTGGGEFGIYQRSNTNPLDAGDSQSGELLRTFCIERNEFIDFDARGFIIDSISQSAVAGGTGGGSPDPISAETAWLFYNFSKGSLAGYLGNVASADALQRAIWGFEHETALDGANPFVVAALAASPPDKAAALARTFVLNLLWASDRHGFDGVYEVAGGPATSGDRAQSMLYVVPESSTVAIWTALSAIGLVAAYRKRANCG